MKKEKFSKIIEETFGNINHLYAIKSKEYAKEDNVFINFEEASNITRLSREQSLLGMFAKHLVSVIDMVHSGEKYPKEYIEEKINDSILYLILLKTMLEEK